MKKNNTLKITIPAAIIIFLAAAYQYGYLELKTKKAELKEELSVKMKTFEKYTSMLAEMPGLEKQIAELRELRTSYNAKLIEGQTQSVTTSALLDILKSTVQSRGATVSSESIDKTEDLGRFKVINATVHAVLPNPAGISDILYTLETKVPYIAIKEFEVRVQNFRDAREVYIKITASALTPAKT